MSAVLLPHRDPATIDWDGYDAHLARTVDAGLTPAVNMDTGFVNLLTADQRRQVLARAEGLGVPFVAGAFDAADAVEVQEHGGTPIVFPSPAMATDADVIVAYRRIADVVDAFYGFELSPVFNPDGRIWQLETYEAVLDIDVCVGAKHSSLDRAAEWDRLRLRDERRPDFRVLTGNDLAIDMVMYGSDYLLGLSTFAPAHFAERDRRWAAGDVDGFHRLNDVLQWLGTTVFRAPVPAYRHDAAIVLHLRGWIDEPAVPAGATTRPSWEAALLADILERLDEVA